MPADTGSPWNIPYPTSADAPDDPGQSQARATKVAGHLTTLNNSITTINSNISTLQSQMSTANTNIAKRQLWTSFTTMVFTASTTSAANTVTIPGGIFSIGPNLACQSIGAYYMICRTHSSAATSVTFSAWNSSAITANVLVHIIAACLYPSTPGLAAADAPRERPLADPVFGDPIRLALTCQTPGCESEGAHVAAWTFRDALLSCGSCGQTITDVEPE